MVLATLLLMLADVPQALLERSNEANIAYTNCLFRITREARAAGLAVDQFERRLASSCADEESSVRQLGSRIFGLRGDPGPEAKADQLIRQVRRNAVENYRELPKQERAMEEIARICRQNPEACQP